MKCYGSIETTCCNHAVVVRLIHLLTDDSVLLLSVLVMINNCFRW